MQKLSWVIVYIQNPRDPRQEIMIELVYVVGDIKINSVSIQKQKINPENLVFFNTEKGKYIKHRN